MEFLEIGRSRGYGPKYVRMTPRMVRYLPSDIVAWLKERTYQSTAEYAKPRNPEAKAMKKGSKG